MLLQQMPLLGISPDVISFNAAITACSRQMQWQVALDSGLEIGSLSSLTPPQIVGLKRSPNKFLMGVFFF